MAGFLEEKRQWPAYHWKALLAVLAIGLLPFLEFLTSSGQALFASDQMGSISWRYYFDALRHGTIPWWNPYGLGGMPTFDAGYGDGAYPIHILFGMFLPIATFISWMFIAHVLIAGCTAYFLVNRFFGLNRLLSAVLAVAYMLNTNFFSHIHAGHTGKFYIMAWLPLSLYFLLRSLRRDARMRHFLAFAISIALLMFIYHPQFMYFVLMGYFLAWAFKMARLILRKDAAGAAAAAARFWIPILAGIGMLCFMIYPPQQWTKHFGIRGSGEKTTYEHATSWSIHPEEAASLIVPEFTGLNEKYWGRNPFKLNSEYPGLTVLFLGILGLVLFRREKGHWFWLWGAVGLLAIVFGLGADTPLFRLFYAFIPGIKNFRAPSMMLFWLATALLIMSADTLARLTRAKQPIPAEKRLAWGKRLLQVGLGLAGFLILIGLAPSFTFNLWNGIFGAEGAGNAANQAGAASAFSLGAIRGGLLLAALVAATRKWLFQSVDPLRFGLALLAVTCADLLWVDANFVQVYATERVLPRDAAVDFLKTDTASFRVFGLPGAYDRSLMQYHRIETTDGWTDNEYRLYREFRGQDYQMNPNFMAGLKQNADGSVSGSPFLDMLNVKYLAYKLPGDGALHLAPNNSALPRAWFAPAWESGKDSLSLDKMRRPDFNPRALVYVSDSTPLPSGFAASAPADSAAPAASLQRVVNGYNRQVYKVENARPGVAVFSELYFPHWRVDVDGKAAPLLRVDYALRGVALSPGSHEVSMHYVSPWIEKSLLISAASLLILLASAFGLKGMGAFRTENGA
ncbi:MAG TPA: hypothetical protein VJ385_04020 [Fibrobacteria bacterium]|nr:hypothetical protein [Fibrobacteria bacterium]